MQTHWHRFAEFQLGSGRAENFADNLTKISLFGHDKQLTIELSTHNSCSIHLDSPTVVSNPFDCINTAVFFTVGNNSQQQLDSKQTHVLYVPNNV